MAHFLISLLVLATCLVAAYGWGRVGVALCYRESPRSPAYVIVLGVGLLIAGGGVLNSLQLAIPLALDIMLGAGACVTVALTVAGIRAAAARHRSDFESVATRLRERLRIADAIPIVIVLGASLFLLITLLPTSTFNHHDDFQTYMLRSFRMLQTGSMGGNPFGVLGRDSFGAQAFLQSFIVNRFPLRYINGFDPVFCFLVSGLLINDIGRRVELHWPYRTLGILMLVFINPLYVNVSALYSGTMFILALIYANLILADAPSHSTSRDLARMTAPLAGMVICLAALKFTLIPFAAMYVAGLVFIRLMMGRLRMRAIAAVFAVTLGMTIVLFASGVGGTFTEQVLAVFRSVGRDGNLVIALFKNLGFLSYGPRYLTYMFIILLILVLAVIAGSRLRTATTDQQRVATAFAACVGALGSYFFTGYVVHQPDQLIRYACPVLIAVLPACALIVTANLLNKSGSTTVHPASAPALVGVVLLGSQLAVLYLFANSLWNTGLQLYRNHTLLAFTFDQRLVDYNRFSLSDAARQRVRDVQQKTIQGKTILAWISTPFHLDFKRNPVFTFSTLPSNRELVSTGRSFAADPDVFTANLKALAVRYILWEYAGPSLKTDLELGFQGARYTTRQHLGVLMQNHPVLQDDTGLALIDIGE